MKKLLILIAIVLLVSGCGGKTIVKVPVYQEIQVVHPQQPPTLTLRNPKVKTLTMAELSVWASAQTDKTQRLYIMTQEQFEARLNDDVDKLELCQYENTRAEYYRTFIDNYNKTVKERNEEAAKNP